MFFAQIFAYMDKLLYFCIVFFMVLDLRLMKIGLPGGNPSFFCLSINHSPLHLRKDAMQLILHACSYQVVPLLRRMDTVHAQVRQVISVAEER